MADNEHTEHTNAHPHNRPRAEAARTKAQESPNNAFAKKHNLTRGDIAKFAVLIGIVVASIAVTVAIWPMIMSLTTEDGIAAFTQQVRDTGPFAVGALLLMQLIQIVIAFIPGEVVQIVGGVLFGPLWGSVIILTGAFLSTVVVYYLVQKLGAPLVQKMVPEETQRKFDFITRTNRIDAIVFVLFLIPALPKDVITYLISLTDVKPARFFVFSTVGRIPGVLASSFAGSSLADGNWALLIVVAAIAVVLLGIAYWKRDYVMQKLNGFADKNPVAQVPATLAPPATPASAARVHASDSTRGVGTRRR